MLVDFYHLHSSPIERVLPRICERLLGEGQKLLVVAATDHLDRLDEMLWTYGRETFLPHAQAGSERAAQQPVLLSAEVDAVNGARNIALADGLWRDGALGFDRVFFFFDEGQVEAARQSWRDLQGCEGVETRYWKQDARGKWVQGP